METKQEPSEALARMLDGWAEGLKKLDAIADKHTAAVERLLKIELPKPTRDDGPRSCWWCGAAIHLPAGFISFYGLMVTSCEACGPKREALGDAIVAACRDADERVAKARLAWGIR